MYLDTDVIEAVMRLLEVDVSQGVECGGQSARGGFL